MVYGLPRDYVGSIYRLGVDGEWHERALFSKPGLFDGRSVATWLAEREHMSLTEMQIEALEWLIDQEKRIGFPTEQDREDCLYPLERQRDRLKSQLQQQPPDE